MYLILLKYRKILRSLVSLKSSSNSVRSLKVQKSQDKVTLPEKEVPVSRKIQDDLVIIV